MLAHQASFDVAHGGSVSAPTRIGARARVGGAVVAVMASGAPDNRPLGGGVAVAADVEIAVSNATVSMMPTMRA